MVYAEGEGVSFEDKFTEYCVEVLESIGKSESAKVISYIHPNHLGGIDWKINGYCLKDETEEEEEDKSKKKRKEKKEFFFETLDLFITYYRNDSYEYNIPKEDFTKSINQVKRFINASLKKHIDYIDRSHAELCYLIDTISRQGKNFNRINVYFLINGFSAHDTEKLTIYNVDIYIHVWDMMRLFKVNESNSNHEPIEIDFEKLTEDHKYLRCLKVPSIDEMYDCYLSIIPGTILAQLYKEYSSELLESNVRAFLGQAGKYNKGIRDTIRNKPHMFLPYNNGITATAESVDTKTIGEQLVITKVIDFQIVNGGQTTASLYHTQKKYKADLSKIFVQMKLTVIKDNEQKSIEIPQISRYANSQNKVTELDLSSNNTFFIHIENLSRKKYVVNPENRNHSLRWYFERVNGQYKETLNKLTPSQQKKFKEQNPSGKRFLKSDIGKFINLWELEPHMVALGSQKNFIHFMKKINVCKSKGKIPGDNFYKKLIANAIIFKDTDKLFGRKNVDAIGDTNLKSYTVAYTVSYFHFLTGNKIDLWKIYEEQRIPETLKSELYNLLIFVYRFLIENSKEKLVSEVAKKETIWKKLKEAKYPIYLQEVLKHLLISEHEAEEREKEKQTKPDAIEDLIFDTSEIYGMGIKFWDGLKKYLANENDTPLNYHEVFDLLLKMKATKNLSSVEINQAKKVIGYIKENPALYEKATALSDLPDTEPMQIKFIYDRLQLIDKNEWDKIMALGSQKSIFSTMESENLKSVRVSLIKKENIILSAMVKAYESIKKLKRFGIKI